MKYTPREETELFAPGEYEGVVKKAEEKVSKNGNEMIELIVTLYDGDENVDVFDYLLASPNAQWKLRHFCESAGLNYESGEIDAEACQGCNVRTTIGIARQAGYPDKNNIADYIPRSGQPTVIAAPAGVDDDIPF